MQLFFIRIDFDLIVGKFYFFGDSAMVGDRQ